MLKVIFFIFFSKTFKHIFPCSYSNCPKLGVAKRVLFKTLLNEKCVLVSDWYLSRSRPEDDADAKTGKMSFLVADENYW